MEKLAGVLAFGRWIAALIDLLEEESIRDEDCKEDIDGVLISLVFLLFVV